MSSDTVQERYTGKFYKKIFRNEDNGYCIHLYINGGDTTTVVGTDLPEATYPITFAGRWINHKQHGLQFEADIVVEQIPRDHSDIVDFISTLRIGIGKKNAKKMLNLVGTENFWTVLATDIQRFTPIVNIRRLEKLRDKYRELTFMQAIAQVCGTDLQFNTIRYRRICAEFRDELMDLPEKILENPFILIRAGFTFKELDSFAAKKASMEADDHRRLLGACLQVLLDGQARCHSAMPMKEVVEGMDALLRQQCRIPTEDIQLFLREATASGEVSYLNGLLYLNRSFDEESALVQVLTELNALPPDNLNPALFESFIKDYQGKKGFQLSEDQKNAVWTALTRSVCVITGGPGTGKSTILDAIREGWKSFRPSESCLLLAPTGRAAVRMTEVTGSPASTIHSRLQLDIGNPSFERIQELTEDASVLAELVIVDESSMIDQSTASSLLRALQGRREKKRQHLVIVGDPDQLPSVAYGNVLADLIASNVIPVCSLSTVYRQAADNPIVANCANIRDGGTDLLWTPTFKGYNNGCEEANKSAACRFYLRCVRQYGADNVILLSPYHSKTGICTDVLNKQLQAELNPDVGQPQIPHGKRVFRLNDRVMMLKNTAELSNGDIGIVTNVVAHTTDSEEVHLDVTFENGVTASYPKENLHQLDLAYALTVHKSQGGQYQTVIMILPDNASSFLQRDVVYTAVSRAKEYFAVFGPQDVLSYAIRNKSSSRYTGLVTRLQKAMQLQENAA